MINRGRMAVLLEIEISEPFDCRGWEQPTLRPRAGRPPARRDVPPRRALDAAAQQVRQPADRRALRQRRGRRRSSTPATARARARSGARAPAPGRCATTRSSQPRAEAAARSRSLLAAGRPARAARAPAYPPAPHCNTRGLTELGKHVVRRMMDLGMVVNPDHMSQAGVDDTLSLLEARRYSGVISPHGWMDPGNWPRLWKLGGLAFPGHSAAERLRQGVAATTGPRRRRTSSAGATAPTSAACPTSRPRAPTAASSYPFKSYDGKVTFERQKTGERTFDYAKEGVAALRPLRRLVRGPAAPRRRRAWRATCGRAPRPTCRCGSAPTASARPRAAPAATALITRRGRGPLRLGARLADAAARAPGQPQQRDARVELVREGRAQRRAAATSPSSAATGAVELVGSNGAAAQRGRRSGSATRARPLPRLRSAERRRASSSPPRPLRVRDPARRARAAVGVARAVARRGARRRCGARCGACARRARRRPGEFVPTEAQAASAGQLTGRTLAGTRTGS